MNPTIVWLIGILVAILSSRALLAVIELILDHDYNQHQRKMQEQRERFKAARDKTKEELLQEQKNYENLKRDLRDHVDSIKYSNRPGDDTN